MNAGKELDDLIAEKIFGWKRIPGVRYLNHQTVSQYHFEKPSHLVPPHIYDRFVANHKPLDGSSIESPDVPKYSTDLVEAWKVVEHIQSKSQRHRWIFLVEKTPYGYLCEFSLAGNRSEEDTCYYDEGKTISEAICLTALNMVKWIWMI